LIVAPVVATVVDVTDASLTGARNPTSVDCFPVISTDVPRELVALVEVFEMTPRGCQGALVSVGAFQVLLCSSTGANDMTGRS
jgi:hypothetical protein